MKNTLIIPDVHGRNFWEGPVKKIIKNNDWRIIFLGDYLACYPYEWEKGVDYNRVSIDRFKEIIQLKKDYPDRVVLLFGNHDGSYLSSSICECRTDYANWGEINAMFKEDIKLFDLAWETKIGDKRYFLSHAGVRKGWLEKLAESGLIEWKDGDELPKADVFNNLFHVAYDGDENTEESRKFEECLSMYSLYRGWDGWNVGSIVWADINEYGGGAEFNDVMFVCGHTQLKDMPIIIDYVADLDVRRPFVLDTETGKIQEYERKTYKED